MPIALLRLIFAVVVFLSTFGSLLKPLAAADDLPKRATPWLTSKVHGTPDPPLPFKATRTFAEIKLNNPTDLVWLPDARRWIATQQHGPIVSFANDPETDSLQNVLDLSDCHPQRVSQTLATLFHHDLKKYPWCFVTYTYNGGDTPSTRLVRFKVTDPSVPTIDPNSRQLLVQWQPTGHTGGSMQFGPDGMLYVSVGDTQAPYPPDADETGQDLTDLEASILRIDVDLPEGDVTYRIPHDNPFVDHPNARGEIWSYGLRNPWKIAFNPNNGDLLAADVGWEMREMIHRVDRGRNHGWSIMEGSQIVKQGRDPLIPITPPLFEHTHLDSRSITGGHYWQSDRIPELEGAFIYGDWMTGKVWALKSDGDQVDWQKELVDTSLQIVCFGLDPTGEVLIVGFDGTIMAIDRNDAEDTQQSFPKRLSQTGIFADAVSQQPSPGVVEYQINAHHWADGTVSRQWIAIPEDKQLGLYDRDDWQRPIVSGRFEFPTDTVVAKTVSYYKDPNDKSTLTHLETQILHLPDEEWRAYNYVWDESQSDAFLQDDVATETKLRIVDQETDDGYRTQTWRHASRSECLLCHIWAGGTVQAFWPPQLNRSFDPSNDSQSNQGSVQTNQLDELFKLGYFRSEFDWPEPIASPHDKSAPIEDRARAYLSLNCSSCHRPQGGGTANFNFDITKSLKANNFINEIPAQGNFDVEDARVISPGDPYRSVLLYRVLKSGRGHMPQFGSNVIDLDGVRVLHDWIASMKGLEDHHQSWQRLATKLNAADSPNELIQANLRSPQNALAMSLACGLGELDQPLRDQIIQLATASEKPLVRDLFEHYLPEDQRIERLGPSIDAESLLALKGSIERGKVLFEQSNEANCRSCHQINQVGKSVGPDLTGIAVKQSPQEVLVSILQPSAKIDPKYRSRQILGTDGQVIVGIVTRETATEIEVVDSTGKQQSILIEEIELMRQSEKSAMPDQLLSGMTADQAADLLAYILSTKVPASQSQPPDVSPTE
ncbi:PQQ-dependent sugar dehydrogenase [Stieleria sp. JC731]|uniref:PQQ-dependent sugar dehydrogenase n=1 Tax=Pirellulaceae TaxID=2691357 RepID=UPI001E570329|nr:PQQ-dependent sugar dehydrogenase [Stieleria sp. JC731]MCC9599110.1 PQQ-dependent sugar dehydrogenase [Stieleria sp. JC731]